MDQDIKKIKTITVDDIIKIDNYNYERSSQNVINMYRSRKFVAIEDVNNYVAELNKELERCKKFMEKR